MLTTPTLPDPGDTATSIIESSGAELADVAVVAVPALAAVAAVFWGVRLGWRKIFGGGKAAKL